MPYSSSLVYLCCQLIFLLNLPQVRNDDLKHSPYLKEFDALTEDIQESDYSLALNTLKTLVSLGYQISVGQEDESSIKYLELPPEKYLMSNGYCPRPLDLDGITLLPSMRELVGKLAENGHNIWALKRISEGWTYGIANVSDLCCSKDTNTHTQNVVVVTVDPL